MPRGISAKSQRRGADGKFVSSGVHSVGPMSDVDGWGPAIERVTPRPSRWATFVRLASHHRVAIIGYTLYLVLIAIVSVVGAYYGAKVGLP